jgi:predicted HicB family RNase H-like nuclease
MAEEAKKQLTLRVPVEVHKKMRILAALHNKTMTEYFIDLVEREYEKSSKDAGPVQLKLPV